MKNVSKEHSMFSRLFLRCNRKSTNVEQSPVIERLFTGRIDQGRRVSGMGQLKAETIRVSGWMLVERKTEQILFLALESVQRVKPSSVLREEPMELLSGGPQLPNKIHTVAVFSQICYRVVSTARPSSRQIRTEQHSISQALACVIIHTKHRAHSRGG